MRDEPDRTDPPELAHLLAAAITARLHGVHTALPAKVERYVPAEQLADIQPLVKTKYFGAVAATALPVIPNVPVQWPSANAGGAYIHLPLKAGDLGLAVFCERSLDTYLSSDGGQPVDPDDPRDHHLTDAVFIPGVLPWGQALSGVSADNLTVVNGISSVTLEPDGKTTIAGGNSILEIDAAGNMTITAGAMVITMTAAGKIKFQGAGAELMAVLDSLITNLINATVQDVGPLPFTAATIAALTANSVSLNLIKGT